MAGYLDVAVPDEGLDEGTGPSQGLAALDPFAAADAAAAAAPPGPALAPLAAVPPAAAAAPKDVLTIPLSFISDLIDAAVLRHFDVVRAAATLQG